MLKSHELLRLVLFDVMETEHPSRYAIQGDNNADVSATRAAIELGLTRGYSQYADKLRLLAKVNPASGAEPETLYEAEEIEEPVETKIKPKKRKP